MSNLAPLLVFFMGAATVMSGAAHARPESGCYPDSPLCQDCDSDVQSCYCHPVDCSGETPPEPEPPSAATIEALTTSRETLDVAATAKAALVAVTNDLATCTGLSPEACIEMWAMSEEAPTQFQSVIETYLGGFLKPHLTQNDLVCPLPDDPDNRVDVDGRFDVVREQHDGACTIEYRTKVSVTHLCDTSNGPARYVSDLSETKRFPCDSEAVEPARFGGRVKARQIGPDTMDVRFDVDITVAEYETELTLEGGYDNVDIQAYIFGRMVTCLDADFNEGRAFQIWCPWYWTPGECCGGFRAWRQWRIRTFGDW